MLNLKFKISALLIDVTSVIYQSGLYAGIVSFVTDPTVGPLRVGIDWTLIPSQIWVFPF